ncbi:hypothetical protein HC031_24665 [Planosporangium thailandense]|uniref:Methyl-accepting transducer domain-containing protein n=1 Tax=Planosporangium thailandense TaxID=765197 RepID=A0ABX0Y4E0_9ACTN|nr:hypothetical protein [Planosporangium thailandense]NJC72888.1 hypothetical protein [Planosporangium thailandense]
MQLPDGLPGTEPRAAQRRHLPTNATDCAAVTAMRADTGSAIEAISRITEAIGRTHDIQESISAAIEVQTDATRSIETSAEAAARSSADIARSVESVALAIETTVVHPTPGPWRPGRTGRDGLGTSGIRTGS